MNIDVAFLPVELPVDISSKTTIVIDVLRASSTIVTALNNGSRSIIPVEDIDRAKQIARDFDSDVLLCGERGGVRIQGFDLGNSPLDYDSNTVSGKDVILTTTNGTQAIRAAWNSRALFVGAFLNVSSVVRRSLQTGDDIVILCSGRCGTFSLEDSVCAGMFVKKLCVFAGSNIRMRDSALAAMQLFDSLGGDMLSVFRMSEHGKILLSLGMDKDLEFCASVDTYSIVPVLKMGSLQLS
jgi:2-phosphosulfolactate phosphatase